MFALSLTSKLKSLIGQPALLELLPSDSRMLRPFHGHITDVALEVSDGGLARYRLVIEPWLAFLAFRQGAYVFQNKTVVQIVEGRPIGRPVGQRRHPHPPSTDGPAPARHAE
jgi:uncharacterized protein involved in type VI secretion and phage assembly